LSGLDNVSRVMILDNDAKFTPFAMKGVDAEHIESICHGLGVLPIVIGYPAEKAVRAAMHLIHTNRQLLSRTDRKAGYY
jgi:hypothetical protein